LVPEAARRLARAVGCRSDLAVASPLGQEGVYRSDLAAGSGLTETGAVVSIRGNYPADSRAMRAGHLDDESALG
jgi:hypothetical protein